MMDPPDELFEFDVTIGADVSRSLFLDDEGECPECGKKVKRN